MKSSIVTKRIRIRKCGDGLGVHLPPAFVQQLRLREGESVTVRVQAGSIVIQRRVDRKRWTEEELLRGVIPEMCENELIKGSVGKEV